MTFITTDTTPAQQPVLGYDLIGDVHGCARHLVKLLKVMGYSHKDGFFQHPERKVVFLGDLIDRGPMIRETMRLVRSMVNNKAAHLVLGNHEYAAIAFMMITSGGAKHRHGRQLRQLLEQTLQQYSSYLAEWRDTIAWLRTMPIFLEFENFRAIHACWDQVKVDQWRRLSPAGNLSSDRLLESSLEPRTDASRIIERLLKGTDLPLPFGQKVRGDDGLERRRFRTKFWQATPQTYGDVVFQPDKIPDKLLAQPLTAEDKQRLVHYSAAEKPLFVGHYWCTGEPELIRGNLACLDYGAVKFGRLVGYRIQTTDTELNNAGFVSAVL